MQKSFLGSCGCEGFWLLDNINQDATSFAYSARKHERRSGVAFAGITWAPSEHCYSIELRERGAKDARKARARATHAGKGLVHFGFQDESEPLFEKGPRASHNTQVIVVAWV